MYAFFFFFNDTATTEIYTLSLHDALPISADESLQRGIVRGRVLRSDVRGRDLPRPRAARRSTRRLRPLGPHSGARGHRDRKSTRLNSSHANISYAVFCLKKK